MSMKTMRLTIPGKIMGAPRQTQRDRWKKRDVVERYHTVRDIIKFEVIRQVGKLPDPLQIQQFNWVAYIQMPASWSEKKKARSIGRLHRVKPDKDNIEKTLTDAMFKNDQGIAWGTGGKVWCDSNPRVEVTIVYADAVDVADVDV